MAAERLLTFQLARHRWGLALSDLGGVFEVPSLRPLPGVGSPILGLAHRHGRIVTVLDLPALLGDLPRAGSPGAESLLVLAPPRGHLALRVPADLRLLVRDASASQETPIRLIDLARLLASVERASAGA